MTNLFVFLIVVLLFVISFLLYKNAEIKNSHAKTMEQLHQMIVALNKRQKMLNDKIFISDQYNSSYKKDMKNLGDDVVELQKVFIEIISKGNNN
ncbi:hypothetical protein [Flavobacterium sp.]|uniref:hypothetical protein n=1 Tax=Flavobacterium sp. TaxID=239 RepID=UPI0037512892